MCALSSADRVPGYEPVGRRFESYRARQNTRCRKRCLVFFLLFPPRQTSALRMRTDCHKQSIKPVAFKKHTKAGVENIHLCLCVSASHGKPLLHQKCGIPESPDSVLIRSLRILYANGTGRETVIYKRKTVTTECGRRILSADIGASRSPLSPSTEEPVS